MFAHGRLTSLCGARRRVSSPPIGTGSRQSSDIACAHASGLSGGSVRLRFCVDYGHMCRDGMDALSHVGSQSPRVTGITSSETSGGSMDNYDADDVDRQKRSYRHTMELIV